MIVQLKEINTFEDVSLTIQLLDALTDMLQAFPQKGDMLIIDDSENVARYDDLLEMIDSVKYRLLHSDRETNSIDIKLENLKLRSFADQEPDCYDDTFYFYNLTLEDIFNYFDTIDNNEWMKDFASRDITEVFVNFMLNTSVFDIQKYFSHLQPKDVPPYRLVFNIKYLITCLFNETEIKYEPTNEDFRYFVMNLLMSNEEYAERVNSDE